MRLLVFSTFALAGAASNTAYAAAPEPISLAKVTKWEINYDEDSCHLMAGFGQSENVVLLSITRYEPGSGFELMLSGPIFTQKRVMAPISIGFGDAPAQGSQAGDGTVGQNPFVIFTNLRLDGKRVDPHDTLIVPVSETLEAATSSITVALRDATFRLETGALGAPFEALRKCTNSLLVERGYDPAVQAKLIRRPQPTLSPATWIHSGDYPPKPLWKRQSGLVQFRLDIDERGRVTGCRVMHRFKDDQFADLTCQKISQRARFKPALDAAGKPIESYYINTVKYYSPQD